MIQILKKGNVPSYTLTLTCTRCACAFKTDEVGIFGVRVICPWCHRATRIVKQPRIDLGVVPHRDLRVWVVVACLAVVVLFWFLAWKTLR